MSDEVIKDGTIGKKILEITEAYNESGVGTEFLDVLTLGLMMGMAENVLNEELQNKVKDFLDKEILAIRDKKL